MPYEITSEFSDQIRAFLRSLSSKCSNCLRRNAVNCEDCPCRIAGILGDRMDKGAPKLTNPIDTSLHNRMEVILSQMRKARAPLRSIEIDTRDYCSKELKYATLNKLISLGKVERVKDGYFHVYSLVSKKNKKEKNNGCNKEK